METRNAPLSNERCATPHVSIPPNMSSPLPIPSVEDRSEPNVPENTLDGILDPTHRSAVLFGDGARAPLSALALCGCE
jgi:hypothetical protein